MSHAVKSYATKDFIEEVARRTSANDHTSNRVMIAGAACKSVGNVTRAMNLHDKYAELADKQRKMGGLTEEDASLSRSWDVELKELILWAWENGHKVWAEL